MNKESFNLLDIKNQVEAFNELLKESTIRKVTDLIGISKTTVRDRFTRAGYIFNKEVNQYIKEDSDKKITQDNKVILSNKKITTDNNNLDKMYNEIVELLELKDEIKALVEKEKLKENIIEVQELKINKFNSELKVKSIKIYDEVLLEFNKFLSDNKQFKQQDIISQALWEFIKKYK